MDVEFESYLQAGRALHQLNALSSGIERTARLSSMEDSTYTLSRQNGH